MVFLSLILLRVLLLSDFSWVCWPQCSSLKICLYCWLEKTLLNIALLQLYVVDIFLVVEFKFTTLKGFFSNH